MDRPLNWFSLYMAEIDRNIGFQDAVQGKPRDDTFRTSIRHITALEYENGYSYGQSIMERLALTLRPNPHLRSDS